MRYYCNICKRDITKAEFLYSIDKFDRPLCREHQEIERKIIDVPIKKEESTYEESEEEFSDKGNDSEMEEDSEGEKSQSRWKSIVRTVAVKSGKGIVKGIKKVADYSKKTMQIRRWKDAVLRRMTISQLKKLCFEQRVSTKKNVLKEDGRSGKLYWKEYHCTKVDLVSRIKSNVKLDDIIAFAKRNHINIRDILNDIEKKKSEWRVKEIKETMNEVGNVLFLELEKSIREFKPLRKYYQEILYQDSLASWLKSKYPDTDVEIQRGSSRPDIVVNNIAIEIKGPTSRRDLESIPNKCMRYSQRFDSRVFVVLFDVKVGQRYYNEWERGLKKTYPDAVIIKK